MAKPAAEMRRIFDMVKRSYEGMIEKFSGTANPAVLIPTTIDPTDTRLGNRPPLNRMNILQKSCQSSFWHLNARYHHVSEAEICIPCKALQRATAAQ
jgi:hypothetical protein